MKEILHLKKIILGAAITLALSLMLMPGLSQAQGSGQFNNPIWASGGADPWIYQEAGLYYFTYTQGSKIVIYKTGDIAHLGDVVASQPAYATAYTPPAGMKNIWAPELHKLNGKWYVYFAADDGTNANHRMYVIENPDADPTSGNWTLKGKVSDATDNWAIDGTVLDLNNQLYMIWSGWISTSQHVQSLYIAKLSDPWTVSGDRVMLSTPEYDWEKHGLGLNEGPAVIKNAAGNVFVTFSASLYATDNYCLGLLTLAPGADPMLAASWTKGATPVFSRNDAGHVYGPGHNGFFKSPDGTEDWIVYHARNNPDGGDNNPRNVRIQPFTWNPDGSPDFGAAVALSQAINVPSSNYNLPLGAFSTIWKTDLTDNTATNIAFTATGSNFMIHWENLDDAASTGDLNGVSGLNTISFPAPGTYLVSITPGAGSFSAFEIGSGTPANLLSIEQWGAIPWTTFKNAFSGAVNMEIHAKDAPDLSGVTDMSAAFKNCRSMTENAAMSSWNTSSVTNFSNIFNGANALNQPLNDWDVSQVTRMDYAFYNAKVFNQPLDNWNVSQVTNMSNLFFNAAKFNQPLASWDVSGVTNIGHVLQSAHAYNQDLSSWDVSGAQNMAYMFYDATSFNADISGWNVSNVTNMVRLLDGASSFDQNLGAWDLSSVAPATSGGDGSLVNALSHTAISCSNYSKTLKGWDENPHTPDGLTLTATGLSYDDSYATGYHNDLTNNKGWVITGDAVGSCTVSEVTLPVSLASFTGSIHQGTATLRWQTGLESNIAYFELQAIYNDKGQAPKGDFNNLGKQMAKGSGSTYLLSVPQAGAEAYYRLKIVDQNGNISYSPKIVQLSQLPDNPLSAYPNPAADYVMIKLEKAATGRIYSASGVLVTTLALDAGVNKISLSGLSAGIYFCKVGTQQVKLIKK